MKAMIKRQKVLIISILLILTTSQTGCNDQLFGRTEMQRIEFIRAVGIDKIDNEDKVRLTVATQSIKPGSKGEQEKESDTMYAEGTTMFEATRNLWTFMDKRPFLGHIEYIIIGEEAAKNGILKYIDFFTRDHEVRLDLEVYIAKGLTAQEIMTKANNKDKFIFDRLEGLKSNEIGQSVSNTVDLIEAMYTLDHDYFSLYLPCIELHNFRLSNQQGKGENQDIVMPGFAVFRGDKLVGYLDGKMGRGLNWLRNQVKSGVIPVNSQEGSTVSLEIIESKTKLKPEITDNGLTINVQVRISSNIGEIRSSENIVTRHTLAYLEAQQEQIIKQEIEEVIKYAQDNQLDFIGAGEAVYRKYPIQWQDMYQENWSERLAQTRFNVVVDLVIYRTYDILEPTKGGGK